MNAPNTTLSDMSFCALDLETTGTNPVLHMIVEVGIIRFTLNDVTATCERLVYPGMTIPAEAVRIHGITDDMVRGAPRIGALLPEISEILRDSVLVIQNPDFDLSFLAWAYQNNGVTPPELTAVDTVRLSRLAFPDLANYKLETISRHLDINIHHHRALADASACMGIFRHIMRKKDRDGTWRLSDLNRFHGNFFRMQRVNGKRIARSGKRINGIQLGEQVAISYVDQSGNMTFRLIIPREFITSDGETYVLAHCCLRDETRYFKMNRIVEVR